MYIYNVYIHYNFFKSKTGNLFWWDGRCGKFSMLIRSFTRQNKFTWVPCKNIKKFVSQIFSMKKYFWKHKILLIANTFVFKVILDNYMFHYIRKANLSLNFSIYQRMTLILTDFPTGRRYWNRPPLKSALGYLGGTFDCESPSVLQLLPNENKNLLRNWLCLFYVGDILLYTISILGKEVFNWSFPGFHLVANTTKVPLVTAKHAWKQKYSLPARNSNLKLEIVSKIPM